MTNRHPTRHDVGGADIEQQQLAYLLHGCGHEVCIICPEPAGGIAIEQDHGVTLHFVQPYRVRVRRLFYVLARLPGLESMREVRSGWGLVENSLGVWQAFSKLSRERKFDLIQVVDVAGLGFWGILSPVRQAPIIIRAHGVLNPAIAGMSWPGSQFQLWLEAFCLRRADFVVANSDYLRRRYLSEFDVSKERSSVIYNGITVPHSDAGIGPDLRAARGWDARDIVALYVGRVEYLKGSDLLFTALQAAHNTVPNLRAVIVGEVSPAFQPAYDEFMGQNREWVWHPGSLSNADVFSLAQQSSLFILPSRVETFGRVVVEAQLCGLPVVATNVGGIPEIVTDGVTGWLVEPENSEALTSAVIEVCLDLDAAQTIGRQAQAFAEASFRFATTARQFEQLYANLVNFSNDRPGRGDSVQP